jgi:hypothetical protein
VDPTTTGLRRLQTEVFFFRERKEVTVRERKRKEKRGNESFSEL